MKKVIMALALTSLLACGYKDNYEGNRLSYSDEKYYIYYDEEVIEIPKGAYITKDNKIDDYFFNFFGKHVKDEKKLISDLSKYFPHGIESVVTLKNIPSASVEMPTMDLENKKLVDSIRLANVLSGGDGKALIVVNEGTDLVKVDEVKTDVVENVNLAGKSVAVLNANGIRGFASKLGEKLKSELGMDYVAENYKERKKATYLINNKLSEAEFNKFANSLGIKYIRIKIDENLYSESDVVVIAGNDRLVNLPVKIYSTTGVSELKSILKTYNPTVYKAKEGQGIVEITVKYNPEDKFIAQNISKLLEGSKLEEDNSIKNNIIITTNR